MQKIDALHILGEVYSVCTAILPYTIHDAYLYGSYARGDYNEDSDVDILLTVDTDVGQIAQYRRSVSRAMSQLSLKHDVTISVTVKSLRLFRQYADDLPFYRTVRKEGIRYVA